MNNDEGVSVKYNQESAWGISTMIDLKDCNPETIRDKEKLTKFVIELCNLIKVSRYGEPQIIKFGNNPKVTGYSVTQLIETSLVSGHFAEENNSAYIDIFSCKEYPPFEAAEFVKNFFEAKNMQVEVKLRG